MVGCDCSVCTSSDPRNQRYRCGVLIRLPEGNLLIDTPPELRLQLVRARVAVVHAVLFTHFHADHVFGLDDLRPIPRHLGSAVPLYCTTEVERKLRPRGLVGSGGAAGVSRGRSDSCLDCYWSRADRG